MNFTRAKNTALIVSSLRRSNAEFKDREKIVFFSELFPILKKSSKNYSRELFKIKKPNPECYFKVLDDFPNMRKVGFEDSITGIHAITQIPEITTYYINKSNYVHHEYILNNYKVKHINDYKELK